MLSLDRIGMTTSPQATNAPAPQLPQQGYMGAPPATPGRLPQLPVDTTTSSSEEGSAAGSMIFLRRNKHNWLVAFYGIKGLSSNEMPLPLYRHESLRDVLAHLHKTYAGQLAGAWLLVAP